MSEQKQKYVVVTTGFSMSALIGKDMAVGSTVELTDRQAKAFVGKVQLKAEFDDLNKATESVEKLQKENTELRKQFERLQKENAALQKEVADLKKAK